MSSFHEYPTTAEEWFRRLPSGSREEVDRLLHNWVWEFATATAMAATPEGRVLPRMTRDMAVAISRAAFALLVSINFKKEPL